MPESIDLEKAKAVAQKAQDEARKIFEVAKSKGFFSHFTAYMMELLMPWTLVTSDEEFNEKSSAKEKVLYLSAKAKEEIVRTITLQKAVDVRKSFILYNVLGFWLGVSESVLATIFGGSVLSFVWNGGMSFVVAYTLYWFMTCQNEPRFMQYSMLLIVLYIAFNVYMGLGVLIFVVPAVLYFGKALCDLLMLINGYHLIVQAVGPDVNVFTML